jgi:hypothetical protein
MVHTRRQSRAGAATTPAKFEYEFNGPYLGPLGVMLGLPVCCYALVALCNAHSCVSVGGLRDGSWSTKQLALQQPLATVDGLTAVLAWCAALVLLHLVLPGRRKQGSVLPDGTRLTYKLNGPCDTLPRLVRCVRTMVDARRFDSVTEGSRDVNEWARRLQDFSAWSWCTLRRCMWGSCSSRSI